MPSNSAGESTPARDGEPELAARTRSVLGGDVDRDHLLDCGVVGEDVDREVVQDAAVNSADDVVVVVSLDPKLVPGGSAQGFVESAVARLIQAMTWVQQIEGSWSCVLAGSQLTCALDGSLAPGERAVIELTTTVASGASGQIVTSVSVSIGGVLTNPAEAVASLAAAITPADPTTSTTTPTTPPTTTPPTTPTTPTTVPTGTVPSTAPAAGPPSGELPATGSSPIAPLRIALLLVLVGLTMVLVRSVRARPVSGR